MRFFMTIAAAARTLIPLLATAVIAGDDTRDLIVRLQDPDENVRYDAVFDLGEIETPGPEVVAALQGALADEDSFVRLAAGEAFLRAGGDVAAVEALLGDPDESVRLDVARRFIIDGRKLEPAVRTLLALTAHDDLSFDAEETFRAFSAQRARQAAPVLLEALGRTESADEQLAAERALLDMDALCAEHVPQLLNLLHRDDVGLRTTAALLLRTLGAEAARAVPALASALQDSSEKVRVQAALSLLPFAEQRDAAIEELQRILNDLQSDARDELVSALTEIEDPPHALIPGLVTSLGVANEFERWDAVKVLTAMGRDAVPPLIAEVESPRALTTHAYLWIGIANVLGQMEIRSDGAVSALLQLTRNNGSKVQTAAITALATTGRGSASAVSRMIELVGAPSTEVRMAAVKALAAAAGDDEQLRAEARAALQERLQDDEPLIRIAAAGSLFELGEDPARVLPVLKRFLASDNGELVEAALNIYDKIGPRAAAAIPDLVAAFDSQASVSAGFSGYGVHEVVPGTLARIGPAAIPALVASLGDPNPQVRGHAVETLGLIGPDAAVAIEPLSKLFRDRGEYTVTSGCMVYQQTVADQSLSAIAQFGRRSKAAFPQLAKLMQELPLEENSQSHTGYLIADALGAVGPDASGAISWLRDLETSVDHTWQWAHVLIAIARIAPDDPQIIADLQDLLYSFPQADPLLESNSMSTMEDLCEFMIEAGPRGKVFVPDLRFLILEAPLLDPEFRMYAADALARVDPGNADAIQFLRSQAAVEERSILVWEAREFLRRLVEDGVISSATR